LFFAKVSNVVYPCNVFVVSEYLSKIMKQIILLSTIIITTLISANGQRTYSDFLHEKDIFKKSEIALFLSNEYLRNDLDSLKILSVGLLLEAADNKNKFARAVGYASLGSYQIRTGEIESGIHHLKQSKKHFELKRDYTLLSSTANEIGNAYVMMGKYDLAIDFYLESLKYGKNAKDETEAFNAKLGLGRAYYASGDTALGIMTILQYKNKSIALYKYEAAANAYAFLGQIEMDRKNFILASEYYEKSLIMCAKSSSKIQLSHSFNNKAILHFNLGELDSCIHYFNKALQLRMVINNKKGVAESYFNIASYYLEISDTSNALFYFSESVTIASSNNLLADQKDALEEMLLIFENSLNYQEQKRVQMQLDELNHTIQSRSAVDKEIIDYTEMVVGNTEMVSTKESGNQRSSYNNYLWLLIIGTVLTFIYIILKKVTGKRKY
jgi:tetratricopeptide (TPR) repeat protein